MGDTRLSPFPFDCYEMPLSTTLSAHLLLHPPLSSCGDRWFLGVWVNKSQQLHKRAPPGSFSVGVASQACRPAHGPAPHLQRWYGRSTGGATADFQLLCNALLFFLDNVALAVLGGVAYLTNLKPFFPKPKPGWQENLAGQLPTFTPVWLKQEATFM